MYLVLYYPIAIWTYGLAVPSGLFIPSFVIGSCLGRLYGTILALVFPDTQWADVRFSPSSSSQCYSGTPLPPPLLLFPLRIVNASRIG